MKILRIYTRLPPLLGGMENHIAQLTREQIKLGHEAVIYFNKGHNVTDDDIQLTKIPLYKLKPQFIGVIFFHFLVLIRLFFNRKKFNLIHIHGDWSSIVLAKLIKKITNAEKIVLTIHGEISDQFFKKKLLSFFLKFVDIIFTTGFEAASQIKKLTSKEIIVQPSGINEIFFSKYTEKLNGNFFRVLTVANLLPIKKLELVLEIAKILSDFSFTIIGEGKSRLTLENIINRENIKNVELVGYKDPEIVKNYYIESDCFLLTSEAEGTPTSMLEAMACGLPVVCSKAGGVETILGGSNFVIEKGNINKFVECLLQFSSDSKLKLAASKKNIKKSKQYTWKNVALNIDKCIKVQSKD
jgi:L-malate glycosyltransferase